MINIEKCIEKIKEFINSEDNTLDYIDCEIVEDDNNISECCRNGCCCIDDYDFE